MERRRSQRSRRNGDKEMQTEESAAADADRLTGAAEALLADSEQHGLAVVTVGWFVEVLQTPNMLPIFLYILGGYKKRIG